MSDQDSAPPRRRMDRILEPGYLDGLESRSVEEVRALRTECVEVETEVSYVRRLAQARLEILEAELDRRAAGGSVGDLIAALPRILAGDGARSSPPNTRLPQPLAPSMAIEWSRGLERLVADDTLVNLPTLGEEELRETMGQLRVFERDVSEKRRALHRVIDALDLELGHRHRVGQG